MNDSEPKSKRMKMDEYNERKKVERRKRNPFPGTRGYGCCSSNAILNKTVIGTELLKVSGEKRKRESYSKKLDRSSYSGMHYLLIWLIVVFRCFCVIFYLSLFFNRFFSEKGKNSNILDTEEDAVASISSFKEYIETTTGMSELQILSLCE